MRKLKRHDFLKMAKIIIVIRVIRRTATKCYVESTLIQGRWYKTILLCYAIIHLARSDMCSDGQGFMIKYCDGVVERCTLVPQPPVHNK